jgi:cytochrome oxidase Cu insertion factor (SCO1/SenC/PrrC family)
MTARLSSRATLLVIAGLFIFPLLLAWLMYTGAIEFQPGSTRNLGDLLQPPVPVPWDGIQLDGVTDAAAADAFLGHWLVLHAVPGPCAEICREHVTNLRQVHRAAGRQQSRIRLALLKGPDGNGSFYALQEIYATFRLLENPDGLLWDTLRTIAAQADPPAPAQGSTYLIDPLGNIMMFYAAGYDPNDLKNDLKRLLTWSKQDEQS